MPIAFPPPLFVAETDGSTAETAREMPPIVEATNLCRTYYVGEPVHALRDVTLTLPAGSFTAVMGPSGSGKSTLLNHLGCLDTADSGSLVINGQEVGGLTNTERARLRGQEVGFIFQTFNLMPRLTALENVLLPTVFTTKGTTPPRERATRLLERVGLGDRLTHRPNELSGGERQRVAIARALVNDPNLLLADEPTGNLDSATGRLIIELLAELNAEGRTILLVTHERTIAEYADQIIHMLDGRIDSIEPLTEDNR